jgi:hypothetical protein
MRFVTRMGWIAVVVMAAALAARVLLIEPPEPGWACQAADGRPWWCPLRLGAIDVLEAGLLGIVSLAAAVAALAGGGRRITGLAILSGTAGLVLFSTGPAALGLLLALIRAVRL